MDWIHCNNCFCQLELGIALYLTSCGHMFCNSCLGNGIKESTCLVCRSPCSLTKLVSDMKPDVQEYFTEPEDLIRKCSEVLLFQKQHRNRLISYLLQSTKKFYAARTELKRMTELCQKQYKQMKEYQKAITHLESQLVNQSKQVSPFHIPVSPGAHLSPGLLQSTPTFKRTAKSTPYNSYQSSLVTPARLIKQRSGLSAQSQRSNTSNKISSTVFTPPAPAPTQTQESVGSLFSQLSYESGYLTKSPVASSGVVYCNGHSKICSFKNKTKMNPQHV